MISCRDTVVVFNWVDGISKMVADSLQLSILQCQLKKCQKSPLCIDTFSEAF